MVDGFFDVFECGMFDCGNRECDDDRPGNHGNANGTSDFGEELLAAARSGNISTVQSLLKQGANPECMNNYGSTPLILSSIKGHLPVIKALLKAGAGTDHQGPDGWTALHGACFYGRVEAASLLLEAGCDVEVLTSSGRAAGKDFDASVPLETCLHIQRLISRATGGSSRGSMKKKRSPK
eukprot:CAMPEP_0113944522 /NCGR_PEP_ID=MMETSP1339-20121228/34474_1 /TAXON_ID=94617 /ORGANISM="Fibrocapsa japonica" /LENGTH=179 /DNA_ID=CAMNT_0000949751 /DNA_START=198 /DNA_END=737 /DNA_ORIENTATION=- /assembly_acc=CAM_ASM_000762